MRNKKLKARTLTRRVWCSFCANKTPSIIRSAEFTIPARKRHFDLAGDMCNIDLRVIGICSDCLKVVSDFHKDNAKPVDVNNKYLIYGVP